MNPRVKNVIPEKNFLLRITFTNNEVKIFDVKPYLETGVFRELKDEAIFNSVQPALGSVHWANGQDFCPDTLYEDGVSQVSPAPFV